MILFGRNLGTDVCPPFKRIIINVIENENLYLFEIFQKFHVIAQIQCIIIKTIENVYVL